MSQTAEDVGAEEKFWGTPELVDMLFPFLDVASILRLGPIMIPKTVLKSVL